MSGPVRSVSQAFAILRLLAERSPLSLSDIGRALGLSPSSCLNLLKTLAGEGAVERDAATKYYRLADPWTASGVLRGDGVSSLTDRALSPMLDFARESDAAVGLWKVASRERLSLIAHAESSAGMRLRLADDQRQPLGGGGVGRALAAVQRVSDAELARRFAPVRWQAELSFADYAEQVREAGLRGFAVDRGFAHRGVTTVAAAIPGARPDFALSASFFSEARTDAEVDLLGEGLARVAGSLGSR